MAKAPTILALAAKGVAQAIEQAGGSSAALLAEAGLEPGALSDPDARIPLARFVQLLHIAAARTGDDCFGLHFGIGYEPREIGLLGYIAINSPTIGQAFRSVERYYRLYRASTEAKLELIGGAARFSTRILDRRIVNRRQDSERTVALFVGGIRNMTEPEWCPIEVHFEHPEPADTAEHRRIFRARLRFDQPANALIFEREFLERKVHAADQRLLGILQRHADETLKMLPTDGDLPASLRQIIAPRLHEGQPSIERAAEELGMSVRTLQRRLRESSVNYSQVIEETRFRLAREYLNKPELAVSEIAYLLGYSELSAFNHAFRRWAGAAPLDYRRRHQAHPH